MTDETTHDDDWAGAGYTIRPRDLGDGRIEIVPGYVVQSQPLLRNIDVSGAIGANGDVISDAEPGL